MVTSMVRGTLKRLITILALALPALAPGFAWAQGDVFPRPRGPVVVVELFTSQACPNCPEADAIVSELAQESDVIALTWPVGIWDYLGWEDTLAHPDNVRRQSQYNGRFGLRWPYTPELVIDGRTHLPGNQREDVMSRIAETRRDSWVEVSVHMRMVEDQLVINIGEADYEMPDALGTLWLIPYRNHPDVEITAGPNMGRTLSYTHVAENPQVISQWAGSPVIIRHDIDNTPGETPDGYVVLLHTHRTGPILGAARLQITWAGANTE